MITDNCQKIRDELKRDSFSAEQWEILKESISHRTVEKLCKSNPNLLVFPHCLKNIDKDLGNQSICDIIDNKITAHNLVGFVGVRDDKSGNHVELSIRSRFQQHGNEDFFLHYMLEKAFKVHVFSMEHGKSNDDIFDFALYLFPHYLKRAIKQGLFKQYRKCEYNDANVRGAIDVTRHIRYNTPFNGRVAYRTSEYRYDNPVTQLIRHTIEYIRNSIWGKGVLSGNRDIRDAVRTIVDITPTYQATDRQRVINQNLKPVKHPFYTEYTLLQTLCLQILQHKRIKYGRSEDKIYGILFDCSWLWEEYISTILVEHGYIHAVRGKGKGYQFAEGLGSRYPDFYHMDGIILDTKYKRIDGREEETEDKEYGGWGQREDQFQMIAYMHTFPGNLQSDIKGAKLGSLIYPTSNAKATYKHKQLYGWGGRYGTFPVHIPPIENGENYQDFCRKMEANAASFIKELDEVRELVLRKSHPQADR